MQKNKRSYQFKNDRGDNSMSRSPYFTPCTPSCEKYSNLTAHLCHCDKKQKYLDLKEKMRKDKEVQNIANEHVGDNVINPKVRRSYRSWEITTRGRKY